MSTDRPRIDPAFLAALTGAVPGRLIKKLDKKPELAEAWTWVRDGAQTTVTTDKDAVVHIDGDVVSAPEHLRCSCLLAPKCLHRLAVASRLPLATAPSASSDSGAEAANGAPAPGTGEATHGPLSDNELQAIERISNALTKLLAAGASAAGAVVQADLLRALHDARSAKLHRLAGVLLTVVQRLRAAREGDAGLQSVLELATSALALCWKMSASKSASEHERGLARRRYRELEPTLLWGLTSAPFRSETGYAGVTTWLVDRQGRIYSVSSVQPTGADATGTKSGALPAFAHASIKHAELSRAHIVLHGASVSADGRIGTGKKVRVAETGASSLFAKPASLLFERSLDEQLARVWGASELPPMHRPAGWDLLWFDARVDSARKVAMLGDRLVRLTELNSTAAKSRLRIVARWVPDQVRTLEPIAFAIEGQQYERWDVGFGVPADGPEIQEWFATAPQEETPLPGLPEEPARLPWTALERAALHGISGGWRAFPAHRETEIARECSQLHRLGLARGADLLGALHRTALPTERHRSGRHVPPAAEPFAAALTSCALYLEALREHQHRAGWSS